MKRKIIPAVLIILSLLCTTVALIAYADDEEVVWEYDDEIKTLYIEGEGPMEDYDGAYSTPWYDFITEIENLVVFDGVTTIGSYSLAGAKNLVNVELADSVKSIGEYAFSSCTSLTELTLSENVTSIADYSFAYDGITFKDMTVTAPAGSYALHYIIKNNRASANKIGVSAEPVTCGKYSVNIVVSGGMMAYYPYVPKYDGTFRFRSTGNHDTRGYVYDSNFTQIAYNDDTSSSTNFEISSVSLEAGKTYYFGARIMNSSLRGTFDVFIDPVEYTLSGTLYAMNDPSGAASDIVLDDALIDGVDTDGTYTRTVTSSTKNVVITVGSKSVDYTFSPDEDADIVINVCDINNDGFVNGRDYAYMKTTDPKYKALFANFL